MTPRASILLALATAPVAMLRYVRRALARGMFGLGQRCMEASWRIDPDPPPEARVKWRPVFLRCVVCGAETEIEEWGLGWGRGGAT